MPRKTALLDRVEPALVDDAERAVRAAMALPEARLSRLALTPEARAELARRLVERGLERGPKSIRVPLSTQIEGLVRGGARLPLRDVPKRVKGGTKAEINAVLAKLVREGRARVVVRTQLEVLVGPDERALASTEIALVAKTVAELGKTLQKVRSKGLPRSILHEDLAALLTPLAPSLRSVGTNAEATSTLVDDALHRLEDPVLELVRIPDLVRSLSGRLAVESIHHALLEAAKDGKIELRPEAGAEFLKAEDVALCPPGPRGTVFSYARRVSP